MPLTLLVLAVLSQAPQPRAATFGFDRVDVISEDPGSFLHYDVPLVGVYPTAPGLRFVEQVKVVFRLPVDGLYVGASLASQSLTYEWGLTKRVPLFLTGGLQTRLLFPRGLTLGIAWRFNRVRLGASLSAFTNGSWSGPGFFAPTILPTIGIGVGRPFVEE